MYRLTIRKVGVNTNETVLHVVDRHLLWPKVCGIHDPVVNEWSSNSVRNSTVKVIEKIRKNIENYLLGETGIMSWADRVHKWRHAIQKLLGIVTFLLYTDTVFWRDVICGRPPRDVD